MLVDIRMFCLVYVHRPRHSSLQLPPVHAVFILGDFTESFWR